MSKLFSAIPSRLALAIGFYLANEALDWKLSRLAAALLVVGATGAIGTRLAAHRVPLRIPSGAVLVTLTILPLVLSMVGALTKEIPIGAAAAAAVAAVAASLWVASAAAQSKGSLASALVHPLWLAELAAAGAVAQFIVLRSPFSPLGLAAAGATLLCVGGTFVLSLRVPATRG